MTDRNTITIAPHDLVRAVRDELTSLRAHVRSVDLMSGGLEDDLNEHAFWFACASMGDGLDRIATLLDRMDAAALIGPVREMA